MAKPGAPHRVMALAAILGGLAVACGAFGAHGLQSHLAVAEDGARRLQWWETAAHYHLVHALALAVTAHLVAQRASGWSRAAAIGFVVGIGIFSGTLYAMALGGPRWLGAVTPLGGLALMVGWGTLAVAGWRAYR